MSFPLVPRPSSGRYLDSSDGQDELLLGDYSHVTSSSSKYAGGPVQRWFYKVREGLRYIAPVSKRFRVRRSNKRGSTCRRLWLSVVFLVGGFVLVSLIEALFYPSYQSPPKHYDQLHQQISSSTEHARGNPHNEKIFIAANIINADLIRGPWGSSLRELVDILGQDNVFVSIYENDSGDGTRDALRDLQTNLPCNSSIVTGGHLELSSLPKVMVPGGTQRTKRIAYLAEVRNRALRPLDSSYSPTLSEAESGFQHAAEEFDRILFLNDVYFAASDAAKLLFSTNAQKTGRADYQAACAIDFTANVMFYDSFVVRDDEGYGIGLMFFPWFAVAGESRSRQSVLAESDAVPVRSCWGGMVAFDAKLFQHTPSANTTELAVQFRHDPEPFWEAAECCLIFADIENKPQISNSTGGRGFYVNPYIRVAYTENTWSWLGFFRRYERIFANLQWIVSKIGYPEYNPRRLHVAGEIVQQKTWVSDLDGLNGKFSMVERKSGAGGFCGQRRMFVMKEDIVAANKKGEKNWEKLPVPYM